MVYTRTLDITRGNVGGRAVTLLLCFQVPDPEKLYKDQFSVAWRVANFNGNDNINENLTATYISQLFVSNPQILSGNIVKPNQWIKIDPGQRTTFVDGIFTLPVPGSGDLIIADNQSGTRQDFGLGIVENNRAIPLLVFRDIGHGLSLRAEFTPVVQAYVVTDYQETALLRGAIESQTPIWTKNLTTLRETTELEFKIDNVSGAYILREKNTIFY